ncbi:Ig-like domain-containing protein [Paraliomyxa miuraensis]|uniref:Ig-like domain-containing protein n=1 Tax=Paraliomyxa miuraensis TaxID=376150 RepID=UPI00225976AE|nr:Ig-like domain-containing protein [Paraliomyxa miuraensis]MCX4248093.1 Ig-like domain-containing protein [Paraliomyxa miuraensis]
MTTSTPRTPSLRPSRWALALALALPVGSGCQLGVEPGELEELPLQPSSRFVAGSTYYLPLPAEGRWVVEQAPEGNANELVPGADGHARFTPVVAGDYVFRIDGTDVRRSLTVVEQGPYEHFNYYATSSLARVGDEVWVAHLFDPHVSRIDPASGRVLGTIRVGPWPAAVAWRPELPVALVAHEAGDTVGFVDLAEGRLVDALWVGDEPAEIVLSSDGSTAYVSLATEDAVVVVDVARREVVGRVATNVNPTAMAISDDDATLYVASYRSAVSNRLQFPADPRNDLYDIAVVDTASLEVRDFIPEVGATLGGLLLDGDRLYVAVTRVAVEELSGQEGMTAFRHSVVAYDTSTLAEQVAVDLGRQESSTGWAVRPFGMAMAGGTLWVTTEGSDAVVGLDPQTLAETVRFEAPGRPRTILADGEGLLVHGAQAYAVTTASASGTVTGSIALSGDPRSESVALGQRLYTGTGAGAGENHSCADCHVDGLTDGNVWSAGGFSESSSRPMFWMEGTDPIGWEGDAWDLYSYLWGSPGPTIGLTATTEAHQAFYDYLAAFVPPPPANGWTRRDGSLSEAAERGRELFVGEANCASCHAGPLTTQGLRLPGGGTQTEHPIVVPSLVASYRHSYWLVNGAARTLEEAVEAMLPLSSGSLDEPGIEAVARYLRELTARELFVLSTTPKAGDRYVRSEGPLRVTMSHPVFDDAENLARVSLRATGGEPVEAAVEAEGRHLVVSPAQALVPGQGYELVVGAGFESFSELSLAEDHVAAFTVAGAPSLRLEGDYVITVDHPNLDRETLDYDPSVIIPIPLRMQATPSAYGATMDTQVTETLSARYDVVIDGDVAHWPPFAFPVGPGFLNRSFPSEITLVDDDGDGIADRGESTLYFRSPGLEATDVRWTIARDDGGPVECSGQEGTHEVDLTMDGAGNPAVAWTTDVEALGYYVTDPDAVPPTGPGPVTGGETYWAISTASFPAGFVGPVTYGELPEGAQDVSEASGAPLGGAALPDGSCIKLTLVFTDFSSTTLRYQAGG